MKKTTIVLLLVSFFVFYGNLARATSGTPGEYTADSQASNRLGPTTATLHYTASSDEYLCQKFKPSKDVIADYLYANVAGTNSASAVMKIKADVNGAPGSGSLAVYNAPKTFENPGHTYLSLFTSSGYTQVTSNQYYWLCLTAPAENDVWWYATSPGSYDYGFLKHGQYNTEANQDFGFEIWSSNMVEPAVVEPVPTTPDPTPDPTTPDQTPAVTTPTTATPAASTPLPTGVTAGSGAAPAATSTSIKAPSDLVVADVAADQGGAIKLDWKASTTTDIDGYKVFRSTEESKGFTEVAKTEKTILTYTDNTAAIGQKYYYMVRAYKTTKESASTSTLSATSVDNLAPVAPANFVFEASADKVTFIWDKNTEADLAGYTLTITNKADGKIIKTIDIASDLSIYELVLKDVTEMTVDGNYEYAITAKDTHGNISEKTVATEEKIVATEAQTADTKKEGTPWLWYGIGVIVLGLAGFATYWFKFRKKKPVLNIN